MDGEDSEYGRVRADAAGLFGFEADADVLAELDLISNKRRHF